MAQDEHTPLNPNAQLDAQLDGQLDARLDARLGELPLEMVPGRDLWPGIAARIETTDVAARTGARRPAWLWQVAAAVVLVAGSSLLTAGLLDRSRSGGQASASGTPANAIATHGHAMAMPASFGPSGQLDREYVLARQQLTQMLDERVAALPRQARWRLEVNLGEMRRAADEINAALAAQPGDPLLEELLLKTYQDELAVLSNVSELTNSLERAPASTTEKRLQL